MLRRDAMYAITRIDDEKKRMHCWRVILQRRGQRYSRLFPDHQYDGRQRALQAARKYRDRIIEEQPLLSRAEYAAIVRSNNVSGMPGVCRIFEKARRSKAQIPYWLAFWPKDAGGCGRAKFSVLSYGEEQAMKMAIEARRNALHRLEGPHISCDVQRKLPEMSRVERKLPPQHGHSRDRVRLL